LWLIPPEFHTYSEIVQELSSKFGSPSFTPHLTLFSNFEQSCEKVVSLLQPIITEYAKFSLQSRKCATGNQYYRCVMAEIDNCHELQQLHAVVKNALGGGYDESFYPHVSLAYGLNEVEKQQAKQMVNDRVDWHASWPVTAVFIVDCQGPITEWKILHKIPLSEL